MMAIFLPQIVGILGWFAFEDGVLRAAVMAVSFVVPGSVVVFLMRSERKQMDELKTLLASVIDKEEGMNEQVAT